MKSCPTCYSDIERIHESSILDSRRQSLAGVWDCEACGEFFDAYWMLHKEVTWYTEPADVIDQYPELLLIISGLSQDDLAKESTCLCCDLPAKDCLAYSYRQPYIPDDSVREYLFNRNITAFEIYRDGTHTDCWNCEHYEQDTCIPLRNIIRIHNYTEAVPSFSLTTCKYYKADNLYDQEYEDEMDEIKGKSFNLLDEELQQFF